jgi:hypothetical protein
LKNISQFPAHYYDILDKIEPKISDIGLQPPRTAPTEGRPVVKVLEKPKTAPAKESFKPVPPSQKKNESVNKSLNQKRAVVNKK